MRRLLVPGEAARGFGKRTHDRTVDLGPHVFAFHSCSFSYRRLRPASSDRLEADPLPSSAQE
jgi:hypothetical protein